MNNHTPLAERMRPNKLEDLVVYFESLELRDEFIELVKMSKLHKDEEIRFEK